MEIKAKGFVIEMTQDELWETAYDVKKCLEHSIKSHWINYQDDWTHHEKKRLERCKSFFTALGRPDIYEDIFFAAKQAFKDHDKKTPTI